MKKKSKSLDQVGAELVETSRSRNQNSLPMSTRLFPYLYIASRRMSLRTMSAWMKDNHGVNISAGQISRALRQPELHLERLGDFIAPTALYVAHAYQTSPSQLLYADTPDNRPSLLQELCHEAGPSPSGDHDTSRWEELQFLLSIWQPIPDEVKGLIEPYLRPLLEAGEAENLPSEF